MPEDPSRRILILDDSASMGAYLKALVEEQRLGSAEAVTEASAAMMALSLRAGEFDLVLCDLAMPEFDGVQFMQALSQLKQPPAVLILSGLNDRIAASAEELGVSMGLNVLGRLSKPPEIERLRTLFLKLPDKQPAAEDAVPPISLADVRAAVESDVLKVHFQPKVSLSNGKPVSVEALARMQWADGRSLPPDVFIPMLEQADDIAGLTYRVLKQAARSSQTWGGRTRQWGVAVNMSALLLNDAATPDKVRDVVLAEPGLARRLTLELTETQVSHAPAHLLALSRMCMNGLHLSIDDYGTGHSSLDRMRRYPFAELKIDRSFVTRAEQNPSARAIFESSVELGHRLGMTVVAEGVESWSDWNVAKQCGCDLAQGFLISPAMPADQVPAWVGDWRKRYVDHRIQLNS